MESLKFQLQTLKDAQQKTARGWTWSFDEDSGAICASKGDEVCPVFVAHSDVSDSAGYPTPACQNDARLVAEALNNLHKLVDALERVIGLAEELDAVAGKRQRAAHRARLAERYDLSEAHRQSLVRVIALKHAFIKEISEAFAASPEPVSSISDYYQGNLTDEPTSAGHNV
jgi:hypothetical protein